MFEAEQPAETGQGADPQLLLLARSIDAELADPPAGAQPGSAGLPAIALERELAGMFAMIGAGAGQFLPSVKVVLDEPCCKALGDALAPVARKYGIDRYLAGFQWRIELQAIFVVAPVALALRGAIAHDLAQYRKAMAPGPGAGLGDGPAGSMASTAGSAPAGVVKLEQVSP